jgi:hypothetical protein
MSEVAEQLLLNLRAFDSPQLLCNGASQSPSFPHVFSGNPGETRIGLPIKTFGVTNSVTSQCPTVSLQGDRPNVTNGVFPCQAGFPNLESFAISFANLVGVKDYRHEIYVSYVTLPCELVIPAWTAGTQVDMDVSRRILRAWMPAIHADMTEATAWPKSRQILALPCDGCTSFSCSAGERKI